MRFFHTTLGYRHTPCVSGLHFSIKKGEWVFLDGPSGSGKSTVLQCMFGILPPLSGSYIDDRGRDIYQLSQKEKRLYRRTCGMIFQDHKLIPYKTVYENIAFALEICGYSALTIRTRTLELLRMVNMDHKRDHFPDHLSGGEAQRVAIARAMIHEPSLILADEPTRNLDVKNTNTILSLLTDLNKHGTTIVFATHDISIFSRVPKAKIVQLSQFIH